MEDRAYHSNRLKGKALDLYNLAMDLPHNLPRPSVRMVLQAFPRRCRISSRRCSTPSLKVDWGGSTRSLLVDAAVRVQVRIRVKIKV